MKKVTQLRFSQTAGKIAAGAVPHIRRPRLEGLADELAVVVLAAPAGFGKTVLMRQWQDRWTRAGISSVWIALDETLDPVNEIRIRLEEVLVASPRPLTVFIDNLEVLARGEAQKNLRRLLLARPQHLRVVLSGRGSLDLGLAQLKLAEPNLLKLDGAQLSFDLEETDQLLSALPERPSRDLANQLHRSTGGWAAPVMLAAHTVASGGVEAVRLISRLPSPWPSLRAYLDEQLLAPLSPSKAALLGKLGALERFTIPLAEVVLGNPKVSGDVRSIEASGLPITRDPDDLGTFVVHPLFAAFLEERLRAESPQQLREMHREAAHWYAEHGRLSDAVRSAFASNDAAFAGELLARASAERRRIGRFRTFVGWSSQLPEDVFDRYPSLRLEAACTHAALFEHEAARLLVDPVRLRYDDLSPIARDDLHAVDAIIAIYADRPEIALDAGLRGLHACAGVDPYTVGTLRLATAFGWLCKGAHDTARQALIEARANHEQAHSAFGLACALALSGLANAIQGRLFAAVADWQEADKMICSLATAEIVEAVAIGYLPETLYEMNDIAGAEKALKCCLENSMEVAFPDQVATLFLTAARVAALHHETARVTEILDAAEVAALRRGWPRLVHAVAWERVRLALQRGAIAEASRLHARIKAGDVFQETDGYLPHAVETEADLIGELRLEIVLRPSRALLSRLKAAISHASAQNRIWRLVRLLVLEARAYDTLGNKTAALRALRRALEFGAPGRMIRSFVDEGTTVLDLLQFILQEERRAPLNLPLDYIEEILRAGGRKPDAEIVEVVEVASLSRREMDVLRMLEVGLSNVEIGTRLFVSQHTVKWHLQHIYEKLGVKSRIQAVAAARSADLLKPD